MDISFDFRVDLLNAVINEINDDSFISFSRIEDTKSRNRVLTLVNLILLIMKFRSSIQRELDRFFQDLSKSDFLIREVTKSAFSQARAKLNPLAFKRLSEVVVDIFYNKAVFKTWHGHKLVAVDGTRFLLPTHQTVAKKFGKHLLGSTSKEHRSMAIGSMLYDVLNGIPIDSQIGPYSGSESDLLKEHLPKINAGDLLLMDRGYPSYWLLFLLKSLKIEFCVRLKSDWKVVKRFMESEDKERIVFLKLPKSSFKLLNGYEVDKETPIACRLLKIILQTGETEVLCTTLLDEKKYDYSLFKELYHYRWDEEEAYKLLKNRLEFEQFSGKTAFAVEQDFHAKFFLMTITAALASPVAEKVEIEFKEGEKNKHAQKINRTNAFVASLMILIPVIIRKVVDKAIIAFDDIVFKTREIVRLDRVEPRNHKIKQPYNMLYKPL
jgi:hypothetical protein